jgi:predicted ATPase/DNA-binding SARP family transcriptional activator
MVQWNCLLAVSVPSRGGGVVARLSITLFGPFKATLDGEAVDFESDKVRALLAYLAVESESPHRREKLAGLLWPDWPERAARNNLRHALAVLRKALRDRAPPPDGEASPPWLDVTRQTVQFNTASDAWIDVTALAALLQASPPDLQTLRRWEQAVELYQGDFLEGFSLLDSPTFEEWALLTREQLRRQVMDALHRLAEAYGERGEHERALQYAWRQTELDSWREEGHQQVMRLLALSGRRSAALAQYETCRRLLAEELGVEPGWETMRLYEQIRDGKLKALMPSPISPPDLTARLPPFLEEEPPPVEMPVFVARERELAQLDGFLDRALAGQGRAVFVIGEAGSGKTALVQEFTRRAQEAHADLIAASGNCNAYTGIGDPYLPFRHILELLTGDVEAKWAAGAISREHACRLWNALPFAAQALVEAGPDLIDTFVLGAALLERAMNCASSRADWLVRLHKLLERKPTDRGAGGSEQIAIFEQYGRVLQAVARHAPLVLVVDDLQWADAGSINLLFHLGRQLAGSRILIVGLYRPEEVAIGRDGERHPLEPLVNEFQREFGIITVNLGQAESRDFVEALLDSELNRLGLPFRNMLYRQTEGHPLFTIELLRGLQERGDLVQDPEGRWVEGPALDWETLPARVEAVIAERIGRLARPLRAALRVASVEGEVFTAEVVARVQAADEQEMLGRLSGELDRTHRLIHAQSIVRIDGQPLSRYRFRHILFQKYLYGTLDELERVHLHEQVGMALEGLYGAQEGVSAIAVQLARHFEEARIADKAIHYLHQAGQRALRLSAYQEAIAHLTRGLALLETLPDSGERVQQELALQLALGVAWMGGSGTQAPEVRDAYIRARKLCRQTGSTSQLCQVLGELSIHYYVRAEHQKARQMAEESLSLAQQAGDPLLVAIGHWYVGIVLFALGEYREARAHLHQTMSFYDPQRRHRCIVFLRGSDVGVSAMAYDACCLWCLGYPDQALGKSQEALALAHELNHPFTLADVLWYAGCLFNEMRRDAQAHKESAEELARLSNERMLSWSSAAVCSRGRALVCLGQIGEGMSQMREGIAAMEALSLRCYRSGDLCTLAEAQARADHAEEALTTLGEAFAFVEDTDECQWEPELYRLKGELLLSQGDAAAAEESLHRAIEVARRQQAKSWELRATTSLARLWQRQGRREEARALLAEIYGWFTEGFDTLDLKEARAVLEELS